jgi:hypothetical protein
VATFLADLLAFLVTDLVAGLVAFLVVYLVTDLVVGLVALIVAYLVAGVVADLVALIVAGLVADLVADLTGERAEAFCQMWMTSLHSLGSDTTRNRLLRMPRTRTASRMNRSRTARYSKLELQILDRAVSLGQHSSSFWKHMWTFISTLGLPLMKPTSDYSKYWVQCVGHVVTPGPLQ